MYQHLRNQSSEYFLLQLLMMRTLPSLWKISLDASILMTHLYLYADVVTAIECMSIPPVDLAGQWSAGTEKKTTKSAGATNSHHTEIHAAEH